MTRSTAGRKVQAADADELTWRVNRTALPAASVELASPTAVSGPTRTEPAEHAATVGDGLPLTDGGGLVGDDELVGDGLGLGELGDGLGLGLGELGVGFGVGDGVLGEGDAVAGVVVLDGCGAGAADTEALEAAGELAVGWTAPAPVSRMPTITVTIATTARVDRRRRCLLPTRER